MPKPRSLRDGANRVAEILHEKGFEAYFAGGCVRDALLGVSPKDYDIATDATPDKVSSLFRKTVEVGAAFGVVRVLIARGFEYEVATYRRDISYSDGRRPDAVQYSRSKQEDVERRDLTINALLQDPVTDEILDFVGGQEDLKKGVIRAVGDPSMRFEEDRLRMMRAVRFAARFGFAISPETMTAIQHNAKEISDVSIERVVMELFGIFASARPAHGLALLRDSLLLPHVLPFVAAEDFETMKERLARFREHANELDASKRQLIALALLLDREGNEVAVEERSVPRPIQGWEVELRRMKLSREEIRGVLHLLNNKKALLQPERPADSVRIAVDPERAALCAYQRSLLGEDDVVKSFDAVIREVEEHPLPEIPLLSGGDLKKLGFQPGRVFKEILQAVEVETFERRVKTKAEAIAFVRERF